MTVRIFSSSFWEAKSWECSCVIAGAASSQMSGDLFGWGIWGGEAQLLLEGLALPQVGGLCMSCAAAVMVCVCSDLIVYVASALFGLRETSFNPNYQCSSDWLWIFSGKLSCVWCKLLPPGVTRKTRHFSSSRVGLRFHFNCDCE